MPTEYDHITAIDQLRWFAASDPKRARAFVSELLNGDKAVIDAVLEGASKPGDGRLRQVFATVYRTQPGTAEILASWLARWVEVESDEFTKNALFQALGPRVSDSDHRPAPRAYGANAIEAYRYIADRLCHRIRNAIALPTAQLLRLEQIASSSADPDLRRELLEVHEGVQNGLTRIARNVEFDTGDGYLSWQSIAPLVWIERNANLFAARFGQCKLSISCDQTIKRVLIRATPFLLETIFGNIWTNAVQASDAPPLIDFQCALDSRTSRLEILVLDAGPGFPDSQLETAFQQAFSTKAASRGRGLLEIGDAVGRLQGSVQLTKDHSNAYRIALSFPVEAS